MNFKLTSGWQQATCESKEVKKAAELGFEQRCKKSDTGTGACESKRCNSLCI
jgi:hypothetical protein